ncbi:hypothetical protein BH11PSE8_BH11PSE8_32600 [soil metagenome]
MFQSPPPRDCARRRLLCAAVVSVLGACSREEPQAAAASSPAATESDRAIDAPDIVASAILLPGRVNSSTDGDLIELVRAIDEVYVAGRIIIKAQPLARVTFEVAQGVADMGFPALRAGSPDATLPYRLSTEPIGQVSFVLYSHVRKPITREMIFRATEHGEFPYKIEAPARALGFPIQRFSTIDSALQMVSAGRIDALLWAQEDADFTLRQLRLRDIHREHFGDFETVFLLPRSPRGDFVDAVLTKAIGKLRESGRLQAMYSQMYKPYDDWQPGAGTGATPSTRSSRPER